MVKEVKCSFCGRIIRNSDKFCIFCGSRIGKEKKKKEVSKEERQEIDKELKSSAISGLFSKKKEDKEKEENKSKMAPFLVKEGSQDDLDDRILSSDEISNKKKHKKSKNEEGTSYELPSEIKDQLEAKMNLAIIGKKKGKLKEKLKELNDNLDADKYEYDSKYAQNINTKLTAFKQIKSEFQDEEELLRKELGLEGKFQMDVLEFEMETMREQLIELKRSYKLHKIKRDVYEELKMEYSTNFRRAEKELKDLRVKIIRWLSSEKSAKNKIENRIRLLKAREKTGEIDEDSFNKQKSKFRKEIDQHEERIKILELYSRAKNTKWFR